MSPRGRRLRYPPHIDVPPSPVIVRSTSTPKPGWKLEDAVELVKQGYTPAHAERVSGWTASVIQAQVEKGNPSEEDIKNSKKATETMGSSCVEY